MLDCDVVLMRDPAYMFDAPEFRQSGNYFWGDIYGEGMFKDDAFDYVGVRCWFGLCCVVLGAGAWGWMITDRACLLPARGASHPPHSSSP